MYVDDRSVQRALKAKGFYAGEIDGMFGPNSIRAERLLLSSIQGSAQWPNERVRIAVEQQMFKDLGFYSSAIDGLPGPATQVAVEKWQDHITFDRPSPNPTAGVTASSVWPRQSECPTFYGQPGQTTKIVRLEVPYPLYLDWQLSTKVTSIQIHEKCHDAAARAFADVLAHYGVERIHELGIDQFGGSVNVRRMRNGTAWSMHAFGCAIDFDADRNQLRENHRTARFAQPEYGPFIDCWERQGAINLGRARDMDWMHFQFARL